LERWSHAATGVETQREGGVGDGIVGVRVTERKIPRLERQFHPYVGNGPLGGRRRRRRGSGTILPVRSMGGGGTGPPVDRELSDESGRSCVYCFQCSLYLVSE